jgi:alpha-glucoside transport system substrate-binding protein
MKHSKFRLGATALAIVLGATLTAAAALGAGNRNGASHVSGTVSMIGIWQSDEAAHFQKVLDGFKAQYPDVNVTYTSEGNNTPTVLKTACSGGHPPDLAAVGQPALVAELASSSCAKPIDFAKSDLAANYAKSWIDLGRVNGKIYGLFMKGANKSTVWYSPSVFKKAGVKAAPATWKQFLAAAVRIRASGQKAWSIGGGDGWTLTDWFEEVYLKQFGAAMYNKLSDHKLKWTDPSVVKALTTLSTVFKDSGNMPGGTTGALQTTFPVSVSNVLSPSPKAGIVYEGDFVPGVIKAGSAKALVDFNEFPFPSIDPKFASAVEGGGDEVVLFHDTPATEALVKYLISAKAGSTWAGLGGFSSPNKNVPATAYTDPLNRKTAVALAHASGFVFDMSDLQPTAFGGTPGAGEWAILQNFLKKPNTSPKKVAAALENARAHTH